MNAQENIMIGWIQRGDVNVTVDQFNEELPRLVAAGRDQNAYVMTSRVGASFSLNRAARISLFLSWENAGNHASFEV